MNLPVQTPACTGAADPSTILRGLGPVDHMLRDPNIRIVRREVDSEWFYRRLTPRSSVGFNPLRAEVYVCDDGLVARWLDGEQGDLRALNEGDAFIRELLFCVHDYLHAWATGQIRALAPELDFGSGRLRAETLEDQIFALLVTEAVATVGCDYWWLSAIDLPRTLGIGSEIETLTVSYRDAQLPEFRRASPDFEVDGASFFVDIARFYCTGRFPGFDVADVRRSPKLLRWLSHELSYGQRQRRYSRQWLAYLAGLPAAGPAQIDAAVACDAPWQRELLDTLGERLWAKIRGSSPGAPLVDDGCPLDPGESWRAPERGPIDFRFENLASFEDPDGALEARGLVHASLGEWAEQRLRLHACPVGDPEALDVVSGLRASVLKDGGALLRWVLRDRPLRRTRVDPVRSLFCLK